MGSIVIFVLFLVASVVIQIVKESAKKQSSGPAAKPVRPMTNNPTVAPHKSPGSQTPVPVKKVQKAVGTTPRYVSAEGSQMSAEGGIGSTEGLQTEAYGTAIATQPQSVPEVTEQGRAFQDIQYNDLQRSIVMAEILGKPKSLKR